MRRIGVLLLGIALVFGAVSSAGIAQQPQIIASDPGGNNGGGGG
jgi:hypothetical protein